MKVLVIGANGQIGKKIVSKLSSQNHQVYAMIRSEEQKKSFTKEGVEPVIADLEGDITHAFEHKPDAVIFTAGSGGHTGQDKTHEVDLKGARKSIDEAIKHGVERYIMVSALGADRYEEMAGQLSDNMYKYFIAKSEADQHLVQSGLNYTIFRPGMLTNDAGDGNVNAAEKLNGADTRRISRDDVATAVVEALDKPNTYEKVIELVHGNTPVKDAISRI